MYDAPGGAINITIKIPLTIQMDNTKMVTVDYLVYMKKLKMCNC